MGARKVPPAGEFTQVEINTENVLVLPAIGTELWEQTVWNSAKTLSRLCGTDPLQDSGEFMDGYNDVASTLMEVRDMRVVIASLAADCLVALVEEGIIEYTIGEDTVENLAAASYMSRRAANVIAQMVAQFFALVMALEDRHFDFTQAGSRTVAVPVRVGS